MTQNLLIFFYYNLPNKSLNRFITIWLEYRSRSLYIPTFAEYILSNCSNHSTEARSANIIVMETPILGSSFVCSLPLTATWPKLHQSLLTIFLVLSCFFFSWPKLHQSLVLSCFEFSKLFWNYFGTSFNTYSKYFTLEPPPPWPIWPQNDAFFKRVSSFRIVEFPLITQTRCKAFSKIIESVGNLIYKIAMISNKCGLSLVSHYPIHCLHCCGRQYHVQET